MENPPKKRNPRPARRYDVYLPLAFNDARPIPKALFASVEDRWLTRFGGLTSQEQEFPLKGIWKRERQLYRDQVVVFSTIDVRRRGSTSFVKTLKAALLKDFEQIEILITETALLVY
jgi:hypothetical protein